MSQPRFDSISRFLQQRREQRHARQVTIQQSASPVSGTPVPVDANAPAFMFVQSFEQGTLAPKTSGDAGQWTLTVTSDIDQTIYFSDRPDRVVGTMQTTRFLNALDFTPENPPNAALVAETGDGMQDLLVVELSSPVYDEASKQLTYDVAILDDIERVDMQLPSEVSPGPTAAVEYDSTHLFIDDCSDGWIRCFNDMFQSKTLGDIAVHRCWVWKELCCFPCSTGDNFDAMEAICAAAFPGQCDPNTGCTAGNLGGCG